MTVEIIKSNLLNSKIDALILTIDGAAKGLEGNIARAFAKKYPDAWEEIEYEINYPIPLGSVQTFPVHPELECDYKLVLLASTLHHIEVLSDDEKLRIIKTALSKSISLAIRNGAVTIGTAILTGGWRLPVLQAFEAMLTVYNSVHNRPDLPTLKIHIMKDVEFDEVESFLRMKNYTLQPVDGGYSIANSSLMTQH